MSCRSRETSAVASSTTTSTPNTRQIWNSSSAKAQQPVLRHDDEAADAPAQDVIQNALKPLLPIIQPAAQVRHDLYIGESSLEAMSFETSGLGLKLRTLVMRRDAGIANGLAGCGSLRTRCGSNCLRCIAPMDRS